MTCGKQKMLSSITKKPKTFNDTSGVKLAMKITISNLGVVKKAEIDVKPLTILVGENNTGKTWLAYTLAGTLGQYG
jgi:polynucleotide 5'-kinase involved in rRNA processing